MSFNNTLLNDSDQRLLIENEYRSCTSLKSYFYFRFHPLISTKLALLDFTTEGILLWRYVEKTW